MELPPAPPSTDPRDVPRWRRSTAPTIFIHAMVGFFAWFGELFLFGAIVVARGKSDTFDGAIPTITALACLAATVGGWIGFVYARRSASDRGLILLGGWGLSVALGLAVLLAVQPDDTGNLPALAGVATEFCRTKTALRDELDRVGSAGSLLELLDTSSTALARFDAAAVSMRDLAARARDAGAPQLGDDLDELSRDFTAFTRAMRHLDERREEAAVATLVPTLQRVLHTSPINEMCG